MTILNLPREIFLKPAWTTLALVIPGPKEPSKLALNRVLAPLVDDLKILERGIFAQVASRGLQPVFMQTLLATCDIPAMRKITGATSHSAARPCNHCTVTEDMLQREEGYRLQSKADLLTLLTVDFELYNAQICLNAAAKHRSARGAEQARIVKEHSIRYSELCRLVGFEHSKFAPPDSMHAMSLGE